MSFLHSEFLFWLILPTFALFYFWLTQKPLQNRWLSEVALSRLHAPETTMGLKGRNILFLFSSLLIIVAMAQPVIVDSTPIEGKELYIVMAIDRSGEDFELKRSLSLSTLNSLRGEKIELMAYDEQLYEIAPRSNDRGILGELIRHLAPSDNPANHDAVEERLAHHKADMKIFITSALIKTKNMMVVSSQSELLVVREKVVELRNNRRLQAHIPLFFYPLGLAMVLILFALSSMSKRRSVSVGSVLLVMSLLPDRCDAGVLDFRELASAKAAYEAGEYEKAERLFAHHQMRHDSPQVRYNRANALYMSGRYDRARYWYERVYTTDPILAERTRYNLKQTAIKIEMDKPDKEKGKQGKKAIRSEEKTDSITLKSIKSETRLFKW